MERTVVRPLGDICDILDSKRKPITKRDRLPGPYPYYGATGILDHVEGYIFDEKLILIGEDGAKWGAGENSAFAAEGKYWVNNHAHVIRPHRNVIDDQWLIYQLNANDLMPFVSGMTVPKLNQSRLRDIPVLLPPLAEQKRTVSILDAAFEGIDTAIANAAQNLANARVLFENFRDSAFAHKEHSWTNMLLGDVADFKNGLNFTKNSKGEKVRIVGVKEFQDNFWVPFDDLDEAQIDGKLSDTYTLRKNDILAVRSNGNRQLIGRCILAGDVHAKSSHSGFTIRIRLRNKMIEPEYLVHYLKSRIVRQMLISRGGGTNISSLNQTGLSSLPVHFPDIAEQRRTVNRVEGVHEEATRLVDLYERKQATLTELKQSLLRKAFNGELAIAPLASVNEAVITPAVDPKSAEFSASILAIAFHRHAANQNEQTFGHVKAQKTLHLVESIGGIDLGRMPIQDAAGPNDFKHMIKAEEWAKANRFFEFVRRGDGYEFKKQHNFADMIATALSVTQPFRERLDRVIELLVPMDSQEAEVFATVHAAWNNLLIDQTEITDDKIIQEARDNWHKNKRGIPVWKFREAIRVIERKGLVPNGSGKRVGERRLL